MAQSIIEQDNLELLTVGIDIGSSTSHLLFAHVKLRREVHDLSSRFVVVERETVWQSPILFTPFLPDGTIDAHRLSHFFRDAYHAAGITRAEVDSGAVILTGEAIKRRNARVIDEIFASESGKFVCATAGHRLESILAAHGSGATAVSAQRAAAVLHVDIGGGTTKLALIDNGVIVDVAAFAVGGRLIAQDQDGVWSRVDDSALAVAQELRLDTSPAKLADPEVRRQLARRLAVVVVDQIAGSLLDGLGRQLELTESLRRTVDPDFITFSGGVAEYIFGRETEDHGDIARDLATEVVALLRDRVRVPSVEVAQRIRATVIGASQFTVQVSGKTIHMSSPEMLPVHNVPVLHLGRPIADEVDSAAIAEAFHGVAALHGSDLGEPVALAFTWSGLPSYDRLYAVALGIAAAVAAGTGTGTGVPLLIVNDGDVGQTLGRILEHDTSLDRPLISIDGIDLKELDFIDIGEFLTPPGVVPVVIKSLLFS
jgi:ethanolamine utilization protein EutA